MLGNPYTPGAGCIPPYLAGRERLISSAEISLDRLLKGFPQRSIIYYGLRGVGKTVLLNTLETAAENMEIKYTHIEASESGMFLSRLLLAFNKFLKQMSVVESVKTLAVRAMKAIASFTVAYDISVGKFSLEYSPDEAPVNGIMEDDLTEILVALGRCAGESKNAICVFIDEFQYVSKEHAKAVVTALHRCNQLRLPVMFVCAGLPKVIQVVSTACSYAERIFIYEEVGRLSDDEARAAIAEPAASLGVAYEDGALSSIVKTSQGYPYFIQEFCSAIWEHIENCAVITENMVDASKKIFFDRLDVGFFAARMSRCSRAERAFMLAMAECGGESCTIGDVAHHLKKEPRQVSPVRAKLIEKGMIYPPARGELAFTVPLFGDYIKRNQTFVDD